MDDNGVRISFDDLEYAGGWPALIKSPEAGLDMVLRNYGKTVTDDEDYFKRFPKYAHLAQTPGGYLKEDFFDTIPRSEYNNLLDVFQDAYRFGGDSADYVRRMLDDSAAYRKSKEKK